MMGGSYKPGAEFIRRARQVKFSPVFLNVSFVGSQALAKELGAAGAGVIVTQVVPLPTDTAIQVVSHYQAALKQTIPEAAPDFVSMEGYLVGRLAVMALERLATEPTRQSFLDLFHQPQTFEFGGITLHFGPERNFGGDTVFVTELDANGQFHAMPTLVHSGN